MSGRSAYVRKKITQTKAEEKATRNRAVSTASSEDNATLTGLNVLARQDTGIGTTNARFLKFSDPIREAEPRFNHRNDAASFGSESHSGGSLDGRPGAPGPGAPFRGPLDDFAYARARRPTIRTEDVSGIAKSGLRSAVDKKSEDVRRGLAKAFAFKKKNKSEDKGLDYRSPSEATVRYPGENGFGSSFYPNEDMPPESPDPMAGQYQQHDLFQQQQQQLQQQQQSQPLPLQSPVSDQSWDVPGSARFPPPSGKLPPIPPSSTPQIKRWIGAGRPVQRWNKLRKDPELWDPNGDVLVYFGHQGQQPKPNPSFRLSSHIIEATESRYLVTQLRQGSTEEEIHSQPPGLGPGPYGYAHGHAGAGGYGGQPTPPISEDNSLPEADGQISYEMFFPAPSNMTKTEQLRCHITTRNVFALLYHASLVGLSLYQALSDLHARLEAYMPPDSDNIGTLINYLAARGIDDVRNEPEAAVALLAWSESADVRWEEGWRESFLHCTGMYSHLEACVDFKQVTPITRALLERACLETQLRVQAAEERLAEFQYSDMWPGAVAARTSASGSSGRASPAKASADRLQKFLVAHYTRAYGRWPPFPPPPSVSAAPAPLASPNAAAPAGKAGGSIGSAADDDMWLTRTVAQTLQKDFAALYDYLVDRDIVWDGSEARSGRKWMLVSESGNRAFEADTRDLPVTDMLVEFDNKLRFPHIPHPYPLVPESIPPLHDGSSKSKKSSGQASGGRGGAVERRTQLAYTEATNMLILGTEFTQSDLIDAFSKFEKTDRIGEVDPATARRGRWILIYGVLQTLASVAVDAPNIRCRDGVSYHMSPRLKGAKMPPWRSMNGLQGMMGVGVGSSGEASHELSHCWLVPQTWTMPGQHVLSGTEEGGSTASSAGHGSGSTSPVDSIAFPRPPTMDSISVSAMTVRSGSTGGSTGYTAYTSARSMRSSVSVAAVGGHPAAAGGPSGSFFHSGSGGQQQARSERSPLTVLPSYGVFPPPSSGIARSVGGGSVYSENSSTRWTNRSMATAAETMLMPAGSGATSRGYSTNRSSAIEPVEEAEDSDEWTRAHDRDAPKISRKVSPSPSSTGDDFLSLDEDGAGTGMYSSQHSTEPETTGSDAEWERVREREQERERERAQALERQREAERKRREALKNERERSHGRPRERGREKTRNKRSDRPILGGDGDDGMAPVIRDFDEMDVGERT